MSTPNQNTAYQGLVSTLIKTLHTRDYHPSQSKHCAPGTIIHPKKNTAYHEYHLSQSKHRLPGIIIYLNQITHAKNCSLSQSKEHVLGIITYPNQNTPYQGLSSFSQPWSFLRHTWHWTTSGSPFEPQKMNPASASCKQTRNYTHHSMYSRVQKFVRQAGTVHILIWWTTRWPSVQFYHTLIHKHD